MSDTPLLLATYIANALVRKLNLDSAQAFPCATDVDSVVSYMGTLPLIAVVPGATQPDNGGMGAQMGGSILRRQHYTLHVYSRFKLDPHGILSQQIIDDTAGLLKFFEDIRDVFGLTFFGNSDGTGAILYEAMRYEGESASRTVDEELGIVKREFSYSCPYGERLPDAVTLNLTDVT